MNIKQLEKSANQAIKNLRESKLKRGLSFMINSDALPSNQCYMEYPDGSINLVVLRSKSHDFEIIKAYSSEEGDSIRKKFKFA